MIWILRPSFITSSRAALDGPGGGGITSTTFDTGTVSNATLSNGNLTATHSNTSVGGARSTAYKNSGKYYFEITIGASHGSLDCMVVAVSSYTYTNMTNINSGNEIGYYPNSSVGSAGPIFANGGWTTKAIGAGAAGDVIGVAIDIDNLKSWWRRNGGNWNNDGSADPATNANGASIPAAASYAPAVAFMGSSGDNFTANFGASAFVGTVPSGFTSGWPA
ncbi:hypothetical protein I3J27_21325 [Bradyrhizobium xenonodulans]|uniref:B30.2/SPRY domain-containing protein n=1 Tax=Bradyrhizobium xenonodulans TaxID=2736875 RepID=A0ABY7MBC8_9BRAD|nr:hypothetical protein [Bradyrhizobium xenonodulans]WBL75577.1 hypothetical protein I3J27_21325 [Bradyrhizobium xenonodulans]